MAEILDPAFEPERFAGGFGFTEGPIWHPRENWLMFSDIVESIQYQWSERAGLSVFRRPSNQANGNAFDREGRIVTCEHASSAVVRHEHGGKLVRTLATHWHGTALNSPNDVVVDGRGRIWFTDPTYGRINPDQGIERPQELGFQGVFRLDPDGTLALVADDFQQPNGLCLDPQERRLYVNDSWGRHIRVFEIAENGGLSGGDVWAVVTGDGEGVPDGMKVDAEGRVFCTGPGGIHVFDPDAVWIGRIAVPETVANFCFGGPGLGTLFITARTSIYRIDTNTRGLPAL